MSEGKFKGYAFIPEKVTKAHEKCNLCDRIEEIAVKHFRENGGLRTRSSANSHWVEVTHSRSLEGNNNE